MELRDVMTPTPRICRADATAREAAALMRDQDIGDVLVQVDGGTLGIVTRIGTSSPAPSLTVEIPPKYACRENLHVGRQDRQCRYPGRRGDPSDERIGDSTDPSV